MTTIKYEINGKIVELEVEDSFASAYVEIDIESKRNEWKHDWRNRKLNCSMDALEESGFQFKSDNPSIDEVIEQEEEHEELIKAISMLLPEEQDLIRQVYFEGKTHTEIARELGVDRSAISHRISRALVQLKKILKK